MVTVDTASAVITQDTTKAVMAASPHIVSAALSGTGNPATIGNLTLNFDPDDTRAGNAFTATGTVGVSGPVNEINTWDFGFIQFQKMNALNFFYAGLRPADGGIAVNAHLKPAMLQQVCLDSKLPFTPWTHDKTKGGQTFDGKTGKVTVETGDHPMHRAATLLQNDRTGVDNFLFKLVDDRDFWTVLVARDPAKTLLHLAHFHWRVRYVYNFKWRKGAPVGTKDAGDSKLVFDKPLAGAPTEKSIQALLKSPAQPHANSLMKQGVPVAVGTPRTANRNDEGANDRFGVLPTDFWR